MCAKCGQTGHSDRDCRNEAKCPNCSGSHSAFSRDCPKWIQEKQVQIIKAERGVSFPEARRLASSRLPAIPRALLPKLVLWLLLSNKAFPPLDCLFALSTHRQNSLGQTVRNHQQQFLQSLIYRLVKLPTLKNQYHQHLLQSRQIVDQILRVRAKVNIEPPRLNVLLDFLITLLGLCTNAQ